MRDRLRAMKYRFIDWFCSMMIKSVEEPDEISYWINKRAHNWWLAMALKCENPDYE